MHLDERDPRLSDRVEGSPSNLATLTLIYIRRSAFPLHLGMIPANDASV